MDCRVKPGNDSVERQALELVGHADQSQHQPIAEFAPVGAGRTLRETAIEIRGAAARDICLAEIDVAEFGARDPVLREHVFGASACSPPGLRLILGESCTKPAMASVN